MNPLAVILVSSGSRGDSLLFKYPYETDDVKETEFRSKFMSLYIIAHQK